MQQKKVPDQLLVCGIGDLSEDSERYKIDTGWSGNSLGLIYNQFGIIQVLQRSPTLQTSNWSGTFFCCFLQQSDSIAESRLSVH